MKSILENLFGLAFLLTLGVLVFGLLLALIEQAFGLNLKGVAIIPSAAAGYTAGVLYTYKTHKIIDKSLLFQATLISVGGQVLLGVVLLKLVFPDLLMTIKSAPWVLSWGVGIFIFLIVIHLFAVYFSARQGSKLAMKDVKKKEAKNA